MTRVERSIAIGVPPGRVFDELVSWDGLQRWSTITVDHTGPPRCGHVGEAFEQTIRVAGLDLRTDWVVTEFDPPHVVAYRVAGPAGSGMLMRQHVTAHGTGSRVELEIDYDMPAGRFGRIVDRVYARRRNRREADQTLANLKALLEDRPS